MPSKNPTTHVRRPKNMCPSCGRMHTDTAVKTCSGCKAKLASAPNRTRRVALGKDLLSELSVTPEAPKRPRIRRDPGTLIVKAIRRDTPPA